MIEILTSGQLNSVQDLGRPGFLDQGIARGGAMDRPALEIGNLLVGNEAGAAGIEVSIFPFRLRFTAPTLFAVTGADCPVFLDDVAQPAWWASQASSGSTLRIDPPRSGARAVIAFAGGLELPQIMGSRATDIKSGFGGLEGRALKRGDRLAVASGLQRTTGGHGADTGWFRPIGEANKVRVMAGAEYDRFTDDARRALTGSPFTVSAENNRQGMRLEGVTLPLVEKLELHSHGIMPGTIQVPPSGQPVIQLAEANTCGGYPKIAHVIEADLWKLAQAPSGAQLSFQMVSLAEAVAALKSERLAMRRLANVIPVALKTTSRAGQR